MITASSIRTPRLRLEPLTVRDTDALFPVLDDPALHTFTGGEPRTRAELEAWIAAVEPGRSPDGTQSWCNWVVVVVETGSVAGTVQATVEGDDASLAWVIGAAFQGHGYAKEAAAAIARGSPIRASPASGRRSIRTMRRRDRSPIRWGCGPPTSSSTAKSCGVRRGHRPPTPPPRDNPRASGAQVAPLRGRLTARHGPLEPGMEVRFLPPEPRSSAIGSVPRDVRGWPPDGAGRRHRGLLLQGGGP